ncbi:MAG: DUF4190 domain-containing protein [Candidatus Omnitrophica bacterium]|nr:DUF4190 domain-containing protein [Candidatus Omnitrophota bacterium]
MQQTKKANFSEFAIVSLTLGIISFIQLGGLEKAVAAIVFGILSLKRIASPRSDSRGEGLAAAGIVLGVIYAIIAAVAIFTFMRNPELIQQLLQRK